MKKILCFIFSFVILSSAVIAVDAGAASDARKKLSASSFALRSACQNVRRGLKQEYAFLSFFNYECSYYEAKRLRTRDAIFPIVNNLVKGYNEEYPKVSTEFVLQMDKKQLDYYRTLVESYCKYNSYKMKDKTPCSAASINSYFNVKI